MANVSTNKINKKKTIVRISKVELIGAQAKPGPILASIGINMGDFTKQFNDRTKDRAGKVVPCVITAYNDKSFDFTLKTTPTTVLLKEAAKIEKAAKNAKTPVAKITKEDALKIAEYKMQDMNVHDIDAALRMIAGTAKQMGIEIDGVDPMSKSRKVDM